MNIYRFISKLLRTRLVYHIAFWLIVYFILLSIFKVSASIKKIDYIYTAIFQFTLIIAVYINLLLLIPRLLSQKRFFVYTLSLLAALTLGSLFNILLFDKLIDYILPGYYFISYYSFFDVFKFFFTIALSATLLKLSKEWFQLMESKQKLIEKEKENIDIQLNALRAQVNPHFLFNSLNVLYSLAIKNAKETPDTIIKLSDILRYVIYESISEKVSIKSEIDLINNYLSLQKYRIDNSTIISFSNDIKENVEIAPMLFLPLVENSFKHGVKGDVSNTFVNINLSSTDKIVHFEIENNKASGKNTDQNTEGGIGLENIKKRLSLLYPGKHELSINEDEQKFMVSLKINL